MLVFQGNHVNDEVAWPQPDENNQMEDWAKREYTFILFLLSLQPPSSNLFEEQIFILAVVIYANKFS
jgi:hypothetical protein